MHLGFLFPLPGLWVLMCEILLVAAAHARLDEYVANWFRLDWSMYHWPLSDYYDKTGKVPVVPGAYCQTEVSPIL